MLYNKWKKKFVFYIMFILGHSSFSESLVKNINQEVESVSYNGTQPAFAIHKLINKLNLKQKKKISYFYFVPKISFKPIKSREVSTLKQLFELFPENQAQTLLELDFYKSSLFVNFTSLGLINEFGEYVLAKDRPYCYSDDLLISKEFAKQMNFGKKVYAQNVYPYNKFMEWLIYRGAIILPSNMFYYLDSQQASQEVQDNFSITYHVNRVTNFVIPKGFINFDTKYETSHSAGVTDELYMINKSIEFHNMGLKAHREEKAVFNNYLTNAITVLTNPNITKIKVNNILRYALYGVDTVNESGISELHSGVACLNHFLNTKLPSFYNESINIVEFIDWLKKEVYQLNENVIFDCKDLEVFNAVRCTVSFGELTFGDILDRLQLSTNLVVKIKGNKVIIYPKSLKKTIYYCKKSIVRGKIRTIN